jgi:hypothetical protein
LSRDRLLFRFERLRDFLWQDIKQQHLGTFLKEVPLNEEPVPEI